MRLLLIDDDARLAELLTGYFEPQGVALVHAPAGEAGPPARCRARLPPAFICAYSARHRPLPPVPDGPPAARRTPPRRPHDAGRPPLAGPPPRRVGGLCPRPTHRGSKPGTERRVLFRPLGGRARGAGPADLDVRVRFGNCELDLREATL